MRTHRLVVAEPRAEHCQRLADLWTHPDVTRFVGGPRDRELFFGYFQEFVNDPDAYRKRWGEQFWVVLEQRSGEVLGECAIVEKEIDSVVEYDLGYFFFPHAWGQGYAVESAGRVAKAGLEELRLPSLIALIHPENERSQSTALRLGMWRERNLLRPDGDEKLLFRLPPRKADRSG